jgi:molybdopterin converting factor small subunit
MNIEDRIKSLYPLVEDIRKVSRKAHYINARMLYAKYKHSIEGKKLEEIAKDLGYKEHSTIINLLRRFDSFWDTEEGFIQDWYFISGDSELEETNKLKEEIKELKAKLSKVEEVFPDIYKLSETRREEVVNKVNIIIKATLKNELGRQKEIR